MNEKLYHDTDSIKQTLNSIYGKKAGIKFYIILHVDDKPIAIYINKIAVIKAEDEWTEIDCINGVTYCVDETYGEVMEMINK